MKDFNSLDWDDLKVFLHAARGGSLGSAARRLKVDQSTISRRIAHLESTLGIALFERLPSGLRVNEAGDRLLCHAERIESAVIAMREDVQCGGSRMAGRVRLATMEGIASLYLASRFSRLQRQHPNLTVELLTSPQTVSVNRREADLFLSFFQPRGQGMVSERLGCFKLGLYASRDYLDQQRHARLPGGSAATQLRHLYRRPDPARFGALARRHHQESVRQLSFQQHDRADECRRRRPRPGAAAELRHRGPRRSGAGAARPDVDGARTCGSTFTATCNSCRGSARCRAF